MQFFIEVIQSRQSEGKLLLFLPLLAVVGMAPFIYFILLLILRSSVLCFWCHV